MGLIKTAANIAAAGLVLYGGMLYERYHNARPQINALESRIEMIDTLDYKIMSLVIEKADDPKKVERTFRKYDRVMQDPDELKEALEFYGFNAVIKN